MRKPQDWGHPCPHPGCSHYRLINRGNMSAIATYLTQSGKRRLFRCGPCAKPFSAPRATVFFALRTPEAKVLRALTMLRGTVALSDIGFGLGVREATVLEWRRRAAQKAHAINAHLWRDRPVPQGQLAAMWHCIRRQQAQPAGADGERRDLSADGRPGAGAVARQSFVSSWRRALAHGPWQVPCRSSR